MEEQLFNAMQGWQCPICKRVYSPFTQMCLYCGSQETQTITSPNTGRLPQEQDTQDYTNEASMTEEYLFPTKEELLKSL